jgi:hypothetical protein
MELVAYACFHFFQLFAQLVNVVGEGLVEVVFVVEIDHQYLVLRVAGSDQIQGGLVDLVALFPHGTGIVDDNSHGYGNVFVPERRHLLGMIVLEDGESVAAEGCDEPVVLVHGSGMHHDFFHFLLENEDAAVLSGSLVLVLGFRSRRRSGLLRLRWS